MTNNPVQGVGNQIPAKPQPGRRQHLRYKTRLPLVLALRCPLTQKISEYTGYVVNISKGGLAFVPDKPMPPLVVADMKIKLVSNNQNHAFAIKAQGMGIWESAKERIIGTGFLPLAPETLTQLESFWQKEEKNIFSADDRRGLERRNRETSGNAIEQRRAERRRPDRANDSSFEFTMYDRRLRTRAMVNLPIIPLNPIIHPIPPLEKEGISECPLEKGETQGFNGRVTNISGDGLGLLLPSEVDVFDDLTLQVKLPDGKTTGITFITKWRKKVAGGSVAGGLFRTMSQVDKTTISKHLAALLADKKNALDRRVKDNIASDLVSFLNRSGRRIVGYHDHSALPGWQDSPLIVIPSAYGETKKDAIQISYYLVNNGFQILRYDNTDHTGESDGEIIDITLTKMKNDILSALDWGEKTLGKTQMGVVAASLAARVAIKAAAEDKRISFLLGLVPAVDVQYTLNAVYCEDLVGTSINGKMWGIGNILGYNVNMHSFLTDCVKRNLHDLRTTMLDTKNVKIPVVFLVSKRDSWVHYQDILSLLDMCPSENKEIMEIPTMHQLKEAPSSARTAFRLIVASASKYLLRKKLSLSQVNDPSVRDMANQNKLERNRLATLGSFEKEAERKFWTSYLDKFHCIIKLPDFQKFLEAVYRNVHGLHPGEMCLDAGCGNGTFGTWLLAHLAWQIKKNRQILNQMNSRPVQIFCLDYVRDALTVARENHRTMQKELFGRKRRPVIFHYISADLDQKLPFRESQFDKVVSNLVLSYVRDPKFSLAEMWGCVKLGGYLALSSLKPFADTSLLYHNYVSNHNNPLEIEEARQLLKNAGLIKQKEAEGHFTFFSRVEFLKLAREVGCNEVKMERCLAEQANILVLKK